MRLCQLCHRSGVSLPSLTAVRALLLTVITTLLLLVCDPSSTRSAPIALHDRGPCPDAADGACLPNRRNFGFYLPRWRPWPGDRPFEPTTAQPSVPPGIAPFKVPRPEDEEDFGRPTPPGTGSQPQQGPVPATPPATAAPDDPAPEPPAGGDDAPPALPMHLQQVLPPSVPSSAHRAPRLLETAHMPQASRLADSQATADPPAADPAAPLAETRNAAHQKSAPQDLQALHWKAIPAERSNSQAKLAPARVESAVAFRDMRRSEPSVRANPLRTTFSEVGGLESDAEISAEPIGHPLRAAAHLEPAPGPPQGDPSTTDWQAKTGTTARINPLR